MAKKTTKLKPVETFVKDGIEEAWFIDGKARSSLKRDGLFYIAFAGTDGTTDVNPAQGGWPTSGWTKTSVDQRL